MTAAIAEGTYRYTITSLAHWGPGSQRFGNCEICGKQVVTTYVQTEEVRAIDPDGAFWTRHQCAMLFGHQDCLRSSRHTSVVAKAWKNARHLAR